MDPLRKIAIHEASYAIVARLFQDYLDLKQVTICRKMLTAEADPTKIDAANSGHMKRFDPEAFMAYGITNLAGIIGQNIATEGREAFAARKQEILDNPNTLDTEWGGKDLPDFRNNLLVNRHRYNMEESDYHQFCIGFLIDYLTIPQVWDAVEKFADALIDQADEKMGEQVLTSFFPAVVMMNF